jgi:putative hydrolase
MKKLTDLKIAVDTHTHTVLSGHAWSTLEENARAAAKNGVKIMCVTEHGSHMPGSGPYFLTHSMRMLPPSIDGVRLLKGLEFDIIDYSGQVCLQEKYMPNIEFGVVSMHDVCIKPGSRAQHTEAYLAALQLPRVDVVGHPGQPKFPCDEEAIVLEAGRLGKMIEINNNSFSARQGSKENCARFARLCRQHDVRVCVASDAHYSSMVGNVPLALAMLEELAFPQELIVNATVERFEDYLEERKKRLGQI